MIVLLLPCLLWGCYYSRPERLYYPAGQPVKKDDTALINSYISEADRYFELGLYQMSYSSLYNALLLLEEARDSRRYNELMELALKINFKLRDKVSLDYHEKWAPGDKSGSRNLESLFPMEIARGRNWLSKGFIDTVYMVGRPYIPYFIKEMEEHGIPAEFSLLPLIESGFDSTAVSRKGAAGMWQFMENTGLSCGLFINYWADKRFDPFASAGAAAKYLQYLYEKFQKWELALAAYNCGETRLARVIETCGSSDISHLLSSGLLPSETVNYVRSFVYLIDKVDLTKFDQSIMDIEHLIIPFSIRIEDLLKYISISEADFSFLNPDLKKGIIPYLQGGYTINLYRDTVYNLNDVDEEHIIQWNQVILEGDMSVDDLVRHLEIPESTVRSLGNPDRNGIVRKGTSFIYPGQGAL